MSDKLERCGEFMGMPMYKNPDVNGFAVVTTTFKGRTMETYHIVAWDPDRGVIEKTISATELFQFTNKGAG